MSAGSTCTSEEQTRTCDDGTWGDWSGSYFYESCSVDDYASCDATPHGGEQTRTRYQSESVAFGGTCTSEQQTRTCDDGTWGDWSGSYGYDACTVDDPAPCDAIPHGGSESRTRYESGSVPNGESCVSEEQSRTCDDGVWGDWSGTYIFTDCTVEAMDVLSCDQQTGLNAGVCHEFFGANAASDLATFCGAGIQGTGCPGGAVGYCDLSGIGSNPDGYAQRHYVSAAIADAAASESLCDLAGGTWSAP